MVVRHSLRLRRKNAKQFFDFDTIYIDIFDFKSRLTKLGVDLTKKVTKKFCKKISIKGHTKIDFMLFEEILEFYED